MEHFLRNFVFTQSYSILSFLLLEGAWDNAQVWTTLTTAERSSIKSQYSAAGIKLMVSAFGSTDVPTSSGADPIATANTMAAWVKQYSLDGIDVDYEVCFLLVLRQQVRLVNKFRIANPGLQRYERWKRKG